MRISKEVAEAIVRHKPVVALESTIIAHGMPYPRNLETAKALESAVREEGAVPATIAVIEGEPVVGLSEEMLLAIATRKDVMKLSRRDLPIALGLGRWGATTVSATIILAAMAGIEVFATGGIGGVHRGAEDTFDISRDLPELGGNDITVVSSGVKARSTTSPRPLRRSPASSVRVGACTSRAGSLSPIPAPRNLPFPGKRSTPSSRRLSRRRRRKASTGRRPPHISSPRSSSSRAGRALRRTSASR